MAQLHSELNDGVREPARNSVQPEALEEYGPDGMSLRSDGNYGLVSAPGVPAYMVPGASNEGLALLL